MRYQSGRIADVQRFHLQVWRILNYICLTVPQTIEVDGRESTFRGISTPCPVLRDTEYDEQRCNDLRKKCQSMSIEQSFVLTWTFANADKNTYWIGWFIANKTMKIRENVAYKAQDSTKMAETLVYGALWSAPNITRPCYKMTNGIELFLTHQGPVAPSSWTIARAKA